MAADVTAPALREFPVAPRPQPGAMTASMPFVASGKLQGALGFPEEMARDWKEQAIAHLGELLGKYRSLRVSLDACVHCGACLWNCPQENITFTAGAGGLHSAEN